MPKNNLGAEKLPLAPKAPLEAEDEVLGALLDDPAVRRVVAEDPLFVWAKKHWQKALVVCALAGAVYYGYQRFQQTRLESLQSAADAYFSVRENYTEYNRLLAQLKTLTADSKITPDEKIKKTEELNTQLRDAGARTHDTIRALADTKEPYHTIAQMYQGLMFKLEGKRAELKDLIQNISWERSAADKNPAAEQLYLEMAALALGRALLDAPDAAGDAKNILESLALKSRYMHTAAAVTLARLAETSEEKTAAMKALDAVNAAHPEENALLEAERARLQ